ncbi:MAG: hypothetical protein ACNFW9_05525 [Candidatus Kerfeldbacteria bacterium]|jgi:hypothetical protein
MLDIILLAIFTVFFAWVAWWKIYLSTERISFYDEEEKEIKLNRGNIWVSVVTKTQEVSYN